MADTNLVSQLSSVQLDKLGGRLCSLVQYDLESRQEWEQSQAENFELWMVEPAKTARVKGGATLSVPLIASAVNNWAMLTEAAMFDNPKREVCTALATEPNDQMRSERVSHVMNWQLLVEQEGDYEATYSALLPHVAITGMGFKKVMPSRDGERDFETHFISSLDCIVPNDTKKLRDARRITHRFYQHLDDISDDADDGYYDAEQAKKVTQPTTDQGDEKYPNPLRRLERESQGVEDSYESAEVTLYEVHFKGRLVDPDDEDSDNDATARGKWIVTLTSHGTVLRIVEHAKRIQTMFAAFRFLDSPEGGFYAYGFAHFLKPLNKALNALMRQYLDAGTISNLPFYFYGRGAGLRGRVIDLAPGEGVEVDDVTQILMSKFPGIDQNVPILMEFIMRFSQDITANTDEMQGRAQKGVREPTVRGQGARMERAMARFKGFSRRVFRGQADELRIIFDLNSIFLSEGKQYQILGSSAGLAFGKAHRKDFTKRLHIQVSGDPEFTSPDRQQARAEAALNLAMTSPEVINLQTGQVINPNFLRKVTDDFLRAIGKPELTRYTANATSPMVDPHAENMIFAQGDTIDPKPAEDHVSHITFHSQFKGTTVYGEMSDAAKAALDLHMAQHDTMLTIQQQMEQEASNAATSGAGPPGPGSVAQPRVGGGLRALS